MNVALLRSVLLLSVRLSVARLSCVSKFTESILLNFYLHHPSTCSFQEMSQITWLLVTELAIDLLTTYLWRRSMDGILLLPHDNRQTPCDALGYFAPPRLEPLPSNETGRSSEGAPSQWPAPTLWNSFPAGPPPSVPSTPIQPSVVPSRHICSAQHLTISFYLDIDIVMHNQSIFNLCDWAL